MVIGDESVHTRPRLQSLRTITNSKLPPAVVITDDSDTFPGINSTSCDGLPEEIHSFSNSIPSNPNKEFSSFNSKINGIFHSVSFARANTGSITSLSQEGFPGLLNQLPAETQVHIHQMPNHALVADTTNDIRRPINTTNCQMCSEKLQRTMLGIVLTLLLAGSWIGMAHMLKLTLSNVAQFPSQIAQNSTTELTTSIKVGLRDQLSLSVYNAPLFITWFCTIWNIFCFPIYLGFRILRKAGKDTTKRVIFECIHQLREMGFSASQFLGRCSLFCLLWVVTNYMFVCSLRILDTTDVIALFSSNVSFIYLLSWVVLHQQFVGIRIVAAILCNTGIALLAYMDGVTETPTLGGVFLASASAAGSAVYKVFFKKLIGNVTSGQLSIFFTMIALLNLLVIWPFFIFLHLTHIETINWSQLPWVPLVTAAILSLVTNLIGSFGIVCTYEVFLSFGLVLSIPASSVIDIYLYGVVFKGMELAGISLIVIGFLLVLLPDDWPDYITILLKVRGRYQKRNNKRLKETESLSGKKSRLRTASGMVK